MDSNRAYQRKAIEQFEQALAMPSPGPSFTNEKIRSFYHPESFLRSRRPRNVSIRSVRVLHPYLVPEQSAFCWGAVPCPFSPTGLAPWVVARMAHIRSMEYPSMQKQMLDFVEMVIDLSAQRLRNKRAYSHIDSSDPELWSLFQVASECRQSVEFWLVFSTVLDYFGIRGLLSAATIRMAETSGAYTPAQLAYMRATRASTDARDVVWHRSITQLANCCATEREFNNRIMHVLDYDKTL